MENHYMVYLSCLLTFYLDMCLCDKTHENVKITKLKVPSYAKQGDSAELHCHYESSEQMYSIKWYRDDKEFFYYIPTLKPRKRSLTLPGISVSENSSNGKKIVLHGVNLDTEGRYKCEVSTEWPHYYTADKSDYMSIVVIPDSKPDISGVNEHYTLGETVQLTCTSASSRPKSNLTWFINEIPVPPTMIEKITMKPSKNDKRLQISSSTLNFVVEKTHFLRGRLALRCSSVISSMLYHETRFHVVFEEVAFNVPLMKSEKRAALSGPTTTNEGATSIVVSDLFVILLQVLVYTISLISSNFLYIT